MNTPIEHQKYPGYYYINSELRYIINKDGIIIDTESNIYLKSYKDKSNGNTLKVCLYINGTIHNKFIARILAEMFLPISNLIGKYPLIKFKDNNRLNISLDNLEWMNQSIKHKIHLVEKRRKILKLYPSPIYSKQLDGFYPNPIECAMKPGYYYIPFSISGHLLVNKEGNIFDLITNKEYCGHHNRKGYNVISIPYPAQQKRHFLVHRIVAMLFIAIPEKHANKIIQHLQINHKDGIKVNNCITNLEWVTNQENMNHAINTGLINKCKTVLSKNTETGRIIKYKSVIECAKYLLVHPTLLYKHLNSLSAGRVIKDLTLFKYDDGTCWPTLLAYSNDLNPLNYIYDIIAENTITKVKHLYLSLDHACSFLNINRVGLNNHRTRKGHFLPYKDWIFYPIAKEHLF